MRISELARTSRVSLPTVKFYLREGLLPPGRATAATQAEYDDGHVRRLRLIRALVDVGGLSLAAVRSVLAAVDEGPDRIAEAVGRAHSALGTAGDPAGTGDPPARALGLVADLGWACHPEAVAVRQLESALAALEAVGMTPSAEHLLTYADAALSVARADVADVPRESGLDAVAFVVLGTVLYEPVLLALRRIAQQHAFSQREGRDPPTGHVRTGRVEPGRSATEPGAEHRRGGRAAAQRAERGGGGTQRSDLVDPQF